MRISICFLFIAGILATTSFAQNIGIGITEPTNKLQVAGSILVTTPTVSTNAAPTTGQTRTMVNNNTAVFGASDSTGRFYDPGGPAGNYLPGLTSYVAFNNSSNSGIEIVIESIQLGSGDSLIIKESSSASATILFEVGNNYTTTGKYVFSNASIYVIFKSNANASVGSGFSILFKRIYSDDTGLPDINGYAGNSLFFDTKDGSFRSGYITNPNRGPYSNAMGSMSSATGNYATAIGSKTIAAGNYSIAMGRDNEAKGLNAVVIGYNNSAEGDFSTSIGNGTSAGGLHATALGYVTTANGENATAMGAFGIASGENALSAGYSSEATGFASVALGSNAVATGNTATALGASTIASGSYSTAIGRVSTASGDNSIVLGCHVSSNDQAGSVLIGDESTNVTMNSPAPNNFRARFANGYRLFTSSDYSTSCSLGAGDNAWTTTSDVRLKENFTEINGEDFLQKIAGLKLTSWNYKKQDPSRFRHYGPMAQDFYAAFGKDRYGTIGNDTTINQADFDGVNLIAIQALEKRTTVQRQENEELKNMIFQLRKEIDDLKKVKSCDCHCPQNSFTVNK